MILYCTCNLAVQKSKFENVCNDLKFTCSAHSSVPVNLGQFILLYLTSVIIYLHNIFFPRFIHIHAIHMSGGGFADIKHLLNQLVCMYMITAYYKLTGASHYRAKRGRFGLCNSRCYCRSRGLLL